VKRRLCSWLVLGLAALGAASGARAAMLSDDSNPVAGMDLYNTTTIVTGPMPIIVPLSIPTPGVLTLTMTQFNFPAPADPLDFDIANATSLLAGPQLAGTISLDLTTPVQLYANVFDPNPNGEGLYNLSASFMSSNAVPLPPALASLVGGLVVLLLTIGNLTQAGKEGTGRTNVTTSMV
jgi:hypothetical protein